MTSETVRQQQGQHPTQIPPQVQDQRPGIETEMSPRPRSDDSGYRGSGKLEGRVALITGGDSGIGRRSRSSLRVKARTSPSFT